MSDEPKGRADFFESILDASVDGVLAFDRECRYTVWNRRMEVISGLKKEQVLGRVAFEVFPFLSQTGEEGYMREALAGRSAVSLARPYDIPESGRRGFFDGHYSPLHATGGEAAGGVAIIREVTERREAEEALRADEERYRAFIANSSEGIWRFELEEPIPVALPAEEQIELTYRHGYLAECNDAMARMYGYERAAEIVGARLGDLLVRSEPANVEYLRAFLSSGYRLTEVESVERDRDGNPKYFSNSLVGVVEGGLLRRAWGTQRDVTDRRLADASLRESEERLRRAQQAAHFGTWDWDVTSGSITWSDGIFELLGLAPGSFDPSLGRWLEFVLPEDSEAVNESVRLAFSRGGDFTTEFRVRRADGAVRWLAAIGRVEAGPGGELDRMIGVNIDVTDRRLAEESLRESESRYQRAAEAGRVGVWDLDLATNALYLSPNLKALLGYGEAELAGGLDEWCGLVHPADKEKALSAAAAHVEGLTPKYEVEVRRRHRDGHYLWFRAQGVALKDARGRAYRLTGSDTDVTEHKLAEERLLYHLHLTETITDRAAEALFLMDAEGRVTFLNPAAEEMFGWGRDEMLGKSLHDSIHYRRPDGTPYPMNDCPLGGVMERGESVQGHEDVFFARDGREVFVRCSNAPVFEGGLLAGAVLVVSDITARRLAEEERERLLAREQQARREAEEANRLKDEFLATLSHELRTPLTAVLGWAQMLGAGPLDEETTRRAVEVIRRNAESQRQIVDDVLDASRIITGKLRVAPMEIDLSAVVREALDSVGPAAAARGVGLGCELDPEVGPIVGDPHRLRQVVWNLLSNAVKFTGRGGRVHVESGRSLSSVRLTVSDTGQGIAPDFLPYVFDRFRQADGSTTRQHGGLGLGLSIVKHLVEAHGGSVHAYSAGPGRGASFTVELPLLASPGEVPGGGAGAVGPAEEAPRGMAPAALETLPALFGVRVLLVEDDPDTVELMKVFLRRNGAEVTAVTSAEAALEALGLSTPDVIISDIGMPGVDGYEFLSRVRSLGPEEGGQTPALALTAYATDADRMKAARAGFNTHLSKPVDPSALLAAVASLTAGAGADV